MRRSTHPALLCVLGLLLTACVDIGVGAREQSDTTTPALTVMTTVAPIADLTAQVAGDRAAVVSLVPMGADAHTYEPRPSDLVAL